MIPEILKNKKVKPGILKNIILILLVIELTIIPLFLVKNAEFGGADGEAEKAITNIKTDYKPWFTPVFEPPSSEIESLLFVIQAAIGAGIVGYGLGYMKGCSRKEEKEKAC